jgi:hypothetical protein
MESSTLGSKQLWCKKSHIGFRFRWGRMGNPDRTTTSNGKKQQQVYQLFG